MDEGRRIRVGGVLLGVGLGGLLDGIVMHQLLQWHHLVSGHRDELVLDGVFHAVTWVATLAGLVLLWSAVRRSQAVWSNRLLGGLLLVGWGAFNVVDDIVNHRLLGVHHVNERAPESQWALWDSGFLALSVVILVAGGALVRSASRTPVHVGEPNLDALRDHLEKCPE